MSRNSPVKRAALAIGILALPVVGISTIPALNSPADSGQNSYSCEGDCKPNPDPTVTQYVTETVTATPRAHAHSTETHYVHVPGPTVTQYVPTPGPTVTRYVTKYETRTVTATATP